MRRAGGLAAAALLLVGCSTIEPFEPPVAGEMNPEPGLFSGPDGVFVLHRPAAATPAADSPDAPPAERQLTDPPPAEADSF